MKRLLRHSKSKLWVRRDGELSEDLDAAVQLKDVSHAIELCRKYKLRGMEIVLKFPRDEFDVVLPMGDVC